MPAFLRPAGAQQHRGFVVRERAIARRAARRQHHRDDLRAQPFAVVMTDRGAQILELAACRRVGRARRRIFAAQVAVEISQALAGEKCQQRVGALRGLARPRVFWRNVAQIELDHIGDGDRSGITAALRDGRRGVALGEVALERSRSSREVVSAAACAAASSAGVADEPDGVSEFAVTVAEGFPEPQARSFGGLRHNSLIRLIAARVV
jgi:hypothetical protein